MNMKIKNMLMMLSFLAIPSLYSAAAASVDSPVEPHPITREWLIQDLNRALDDTDAAGNKLGVAGYLRDKAYTGWVHATQFLKWPALTYGAYSLVDSSGVLGAAGNSWPRWIARIVAGLAAARLFDKSRSDASNILDYEFQKKKFNELINRYVSFKKSPYDSQSISTELTRVAGEVTVLRPAQHNDQESRGKTAILAVIEYLLNKIVPSLDTLKKVSQGQTEVVTAVKDGLDLALERATRSLEDLNLTQSTSGSGGRSSQQSEVLLRLAEAKQTVLFFIKRMQALAERLATPVEPANV